MLFVMAVENSLCVGLAGKTHVDYAYLKSGLGYRNVIVERTRTSVSSYWKRIASELKTKCVLI